MAEAENTELEIEEQSTVETNEDDNFDPIKMMETDLGEKGKEALLSQVEEKPDEKPVVESETVELDDYTSELNEKLTSFNKDYTMPEELKTGMKDGKPLTKAERFELFTKEIINNTDFGEDEFVRSYTKAKESGLSPNDFIKNYTEQYAVLDLPDKEFYQQHMQAIAEHKKKGWTAEQIEKHIEGLDPIKLSLEVDGLKDQYRQSIEAKMNLQSEAQMKADLEVFQKEEEVNETIYKNFINANKEVLNIGGVEFDEMSRNSFLEEVPTLLKRDPKTRINAAQEWLSADDNFLEVLPSIWLAMKGKNKEYTSKVKEAVKAKTIETLDNQPTKFKASSKEIQDFDAEKLMKSDVQ